MDSVNVLHRIRLEKPIIFFTAFKMHLFIFSYLGWNLWTRSRHCPNRTRYWKKDLIGKHQVVGLKFSYSWNICMSSHFWNDSTFVVWQLNDLMGPQIKGEKRMVSSYIEDGPSMHCYCKTHFTVVPFMTSNLFVHNKHLLIGKMTRLIYTWSIQGKP